MAVADYFDCSALFEETRCFVANDLLLRKEGEEPDDEWNMVSIGSKALIYVEQALMNDQEDYLEWAIRTCIFALNYVPEENFLSLSPKAFESLMSSSFHEGFSLPDGCIRDRSSKPHCEKQSRIVCQYLMSHPELINSSLLVKLTRIEMMLRVEKSVVKTS
jgi:hypothetical protein